MSMPNLSCALNTLPKLAGSSFFVYNNTKVICTVTHMQDFHTNQIDIIFHDSLSTYKNQIEKYYVSVLQDIHKIIAHETKTVKYEIAFYLVYGSENKLLCAVNAMVLALINSGYPLKQMIYACSAYKNSNKENEEFCVMNAENEILYAHKSNTCDNYEIIKDEMNFCLENKFCGDIFADAQ